MSLLQVLNLPLPGRLAAAHAAAASTHGAHASLAMPPPPVPSRQGASAPASAHPPLVDADAKRVRASIALQKQKAHDTLAKLESVAPALEQRIAAAKGDDRKKLLAAQAEFEKRKKEAVHAIEQADADLEALDSPQTRREELVTILARHRSGMSRGTEMEIDAAGLKPQTARNHDVTTTTTSYVDGEAVVDKVREQRHVGLGGSTSTQSHETEVRNDKLAVKTGDEKRTHISTTGKASVETKKSVEVELADGRKAAVGHTDSKEISAKGASHEHTVTRTNLDGSSSSSTSKHEVERGEGKVTAKTSTSVTTTSASGTSKTRDTGASGGLIAGKDGIGVHGGVEGDKKVTTKKGMEAGLVAGVHANVLCKIGEPIDNPKVYPVSLTVSFGASAAVSGGAGKKEGSKASVGVEVKGGVDRTLVRTYMLGEAELGAYVQALQNASKKGGKVAATHQEFAIISAGVNKSWDVARQMWESGGGAITAKTGDSLKHTGDSVEVTNTRTGGVGVNAKVGPVGVGVGVTDTQANSTKVTRNDKGALDVDTKSAHKREKQVSGSVSVGVASMSVGAVYTHQTSFGYSITIDPKNDSGGKMLAELGRCKTELQYEVFIATHTGKITVTGRTKGKADAKATQTGVSVAGVKASIGTHRGVEEETKTDGKDKLVEKIVVGQAGAGGTLGPISDSEDDDAVAKIDGDGNATLTMTHTTNDNHNARARDKHLNKIKAKVGLAKKEGPATGALTQATGGEEDDSATHDVSGLTLTTKDLKRLGGIACRSLPAWMGACRRHQENDDWRKAGIAIANAKGAAAVVAEEVARFIGGDEVERRQTVELFIRGGHNPIKMGKAFEFPDALRSLQADYEMIVADSLPDTLNALAKDKAAKAVEECKHLAALADTIEGKIRACNDFDNKATKMEMLQRLEWRRQQLVEGIHGYAGERNPESNPKVLQEKSDRLIAECTAFGTEQMRLQSTLADMLDGDKQFVTANGDMQKARKLIRQLEHLQQRWTSDYMMLQETMKKLGVPNFDLVVLKPNAALLAFYEKAARLS